jgi:hypothetical protein
MELTGKITHLLETESGTSAKGDWQKRTIVIQNDTDKYPKPQAIQLWGDLCNLQLNKGDEITAHINIESREYNGRWFTDVRAWKIDVDSGAPQQAKASKPLPPAPVFDDGNDDDLPF